MKNRRTFLKALGGVTAAGSLSGFTPFIPNGLKAGNSNPDPELPDYRTNKYLGGNEPNIHLAYYDPAKGHVPNPGMGINIYGYSDHMFDTTHPPEGYLPLEKEPHLTKFKKIIDQIPDHPYADNIYIRVEWCDVQKEKGKLNFREEWHYLLDMIEKYGKRWSLRIMNNNKQSMQAYNIPDFLVGKLKMIPYKGDPRVYPRYHSAYDDEYLKWWGEMLQMLGDLYDKHPLLEFADVSGMGFWGEGHLFGCDPDFKIPIDRYDYIQRELINQHVSAFPNTPAVLNIHHTWDGMAGREALKNGLWLRRDSLLPNFSTFETSMIQSLQPGAAMLWETIMPYKDRSPRRVGEFASKRFDELPQRYFDFGGCYAVIGFNPWDAFFALDECWDVYENLSGNIGYRIRPAIIWRRKVKDNPEEIVLGMINDGCSSAPGSLEITAQFAGKESVKIELEPGTPNPGSRMTLTPIVIPEAYQGTKDKIPVKLFVSLKILTKTRPVKWAVDDNGTPGKEFLEFPLYPTSSEWVRSPWVAK